MGTDMQNFDLFGMEASATSADVYPAPLESRSVGAIVRRVVEHLNGNHTGEIPTMVIPCQTHDVGGLIIGVKNLTNDGG